MRSKAFFGVASVLLCAAAAGGLTRVNEIERPVPPLGLSALTRVAGDAYWAVNDSRGELHALTIGVDRATGAVTNCAVGACTLLAGRKDLESLVWDPGAGVVWVGDEDDASVRAFDPATGAEKARLDLPKRQLACRSNRSIESLALHPNGRELWAANEEALCSAQVWRKLAKVAPPGVDDGPLATRAAGSLVRLMRFSRARPGDPWRQTGEWAYRTDAVGGRNFPGLAAQSGVADMCFLPDGSLLALEREMSVKRGFMPTFRCRIYRVDVAGATDVSAVDSLKAAGDAVRPAAKKLVYEADTNHAMYEGLALGPELADGSRALLLVSDADLGAEPRICVLRWTPENTKD